MLLHERAHFLCKSRPFSLLALTAVSRRDALMQALRYLRLLKKTPTLTRLLFEKDTARAEFFKEPVSPAHFQIGAEIVEVMET